MRVGLAVWLLTPIVAIGLIAASVVTQSLAGASRPVWVPVEASSETISMPIDLALGWSSPPPLRAPAWAGVVQHVYAAPGDQLETGSRIARIDGVDRIGVASTAPFYRAIGAGDRGEDVIELNTLLRQLGYQAPEGDLATWATVTAVDALATRLGAGRSKVFDPAWVVHLPSAPYVLASTDLDVGALALPAGSVIARGQQVLESSTVVRRGSFPADTSAGGSGSPTPLDPAEVARVALSVPEDQKLYLSGSLLEMDDDRSRVADASLAAIEEQLVGAPRVVQALLKRTPVAGDLVVPTTALFANPTGATCVLVEPEEVVRVEVLATNAGQSTIRGSLSAGQRVQVLTGGGGRRCT